MPLLCAARAAKHYTADYGRKEASTTAAMGIGWRASRPASKTGRTLGQLGLSDRTVHTEGQGVDEEVDSDNWPWGTCARVQHRPREERARCLNRSAGPTSNGALRAWGARGALASETLRGVWWPEHAQHAANQLHALRGVADVTIMAQSMRP